MTTKPPPGLAASGHTGSSDPELEDLSDQIDLDSSQDVTVEASEESTEESTLEASSDESPLEVDEEAAVDPGETPPPLSPLMPPNLLSSTPPPRRAPTLLGLPLPTLPLPGVTAVARPSSLGPELDDDDDEVTVMAQRAVTDDDEEATKVEPAATALHAKASRDEDDDEVTTALSAQASVEREKALRKSVPPSLDLPLPSPNFRPGYAGQFGQSGQSKLADLDDEFEDPEDGDGVDLAHDTPAAISIYDEAIAESSYAPELDEPSSELEAVLAPRRPTGSPPLGSSIAGLGTYARAEGFGAARLPSPNPGYGVSLPSPGQAPGPSSSPFSARLAPVGSPYAVRTTSPSLPAIQIPAPSGAAALPSGSSGLFYKVQVPVVGLIALLVASGAGGVLVGAKLWRSGVAIPPSPTGAATAAAPPAAPVAVQQAPSAPAPVAPAATPEPAAAAPPSAAAPAGAAPANAPTTAPADEQATALVPPAPRPVKHARPLARKPTLAGATTGSPAAPATPRPKKVKIAKGWVDPFAE
jgi:hypothetical protein